MAYSIFQIFKRGIGPSSSHTVGPMKAANKFLDLLMQKKQIWQNVHQIKVDLYGSLALTGKGHATDKAILLGLLGEIPESVDTNQTDNMIRQIEQSRKLHLNKEKHIDFKMNEHMLFNKNEFLKFHSNAMRLSAFDQSKQMILSEIYYSTGGGFIISETERQSPQESSQVDQPRFPYSTCQQLMQISDETQLSIQEITLKNELTWNTENEITKQLGLI